MRLVLLGAGGDSETPDPLAFRRGEADGPHPLQTEPWVCMMNPSGEHVVRGGKYERLVTDAECARAQIPDAPLPRLREGPA
jgi:hypothetical protein